MQRDLFILRDSRNAAIVTDLSVTREAVISPPRSDLEDDEDSWIEDEAPAPSGDGSINPLPSICQKDMKHIRSSLRWIAVAAIIAAMASIFT